jgi:ATP-dependent RNA helicase RhlB
LPEIPLVGVTGKKEYSTGMKFSELTLTEETRKGIEAAGFDTCMPVQEKVFEQSLSGGDVMVQSQTGTGKTAAFLITIFEKYARRKPDEQIKALVIVPTRELAVQIEHDAKILSQGLKDLRIGTFYGGVGYAEQDKQLSRGVDLYIGTPGRLMDYGKARKLSFDQMDIVVVDEADRLFDMGFYQDILHMFKRMRPKESRQTLLFSATLTGRARNLAWDFMNNPFEVDIESESMTVDEINQQLFHISKSEKFPMLLRILAKENPGNAIIFTNTKSMAVEVAKRLEINGYDAHVLMGDLPQSKRLRVIQKMKKGDIRFLVATDVAARGLHVEDLELVVNYDVPEDYENYVHRVGRTARAGKSGLAITLACEQFVYSLEAIEEYIQMKIPVVWPEEDVYPKIEDKSAHLSFRQLVKSYRGSDAKGRRSKDSRSRSNRRSPSQGQKRVTKDDSRRPEPSRKKRPSHNKPSSSAGDTQKPVDQNRQKPAPQNRQKPASRGGQKQAPQGRQNSGAQNGKKSASPEQRPKASAALEHLSFDDRLAYYKKKYAGELKGQEESAAKKKPADSRESGKPQPKKPTKQRNPDASQAKKPKEPENKRDQQPEEEKKGILGKLLKRKKR